MTEMTDKLGHETVGRFRRLFPEFRGEIIRNFYKGWFKNMNLVMPAEMTVDEILERLPELCGQVTEVIGENGKVEERILRCSTTVREMEGMT